MNYRLLELHRTEENVLEWTAKGAFPTYTDALSVMRTMLLARAANGHSTNFRIVSGTDHIMAWYGPQANPHAADWADVTAPDFIPEDF